MFDKILRRMREKVQQREYVMTILAEEEMGEDGFTNFDVERVILAGKIIKRQKDRRTSEAKYLIEGDTFSGRRAVAVAKFGFSGKLVFVTVYRK